MNQFKKYKVGEGISPKKDESYYNAGDIGTMLQESKMFLYNGNNLVTLGLAEQDLNKVIQGLEQIIEGSTEIVAKAKHLQSKMAEENHYKIIIAIEDMVVKPEKEE